MLSGSTHEMKNVRGFGLQCPWSNCFPQIYAQSKAPCVLTAFADFREVTDHIWKYHSSLLSCGECNHRFIGAKRTEKDRTQLDALKDTHAENCQRDKNVNHGIVTMTDVQDESLRKWRAQNSKDRGSVKLNYDSLCRSLFGNGVQPPEKPEYHYFIPEYTTNPHSDRLGLQNIDYVRRQRNAGLSAISNPQQQPNPTTYHSQHFGIIQHTMYPLSLDPPHPYANIEVMKPPPGHDKDSGYDSQDREQLAPPPNTSDYINPMDIQSSTGWQHVFALTGSFSQGISEMRAPFEMDYELENSEDPSN